MSFSKAVSLFTVIELIRFIGGSERGDYIKGIVRHPLVVQGWGKTGITGDNGVFMEGLGKSLSVRKVNRIVVVDNVMLQCKRLVILITFLNMFYLLHQRQTHHCNQINLLSPKHSSSSP